MQASSMTGMRRMLRLTGRKYYHTYPKQGIRWIGGYLLDVGREVDTPLFVIGEWAYEMQVERI